MKIIRYQLNDGHGPRFGCVEDGTVKQLTGTLEQGFAPGEEVGPLDGVRLLAPCTPPKVMAVAINFSGIDGFDHSQQEPLCFAMPGTTVANPGDTVVNPFPKLPWWGEAELGVVIGRTMKNVPVDRVRDYVLGFTIGNDTTVDSIDGRDHHLARAKCPDGFCALGPWIDTEYVPEGHTVEAIQNGEIIRRGALDEMFWTWDVVVSRLSQWITLEPWDVVLTGNPPDTVGMRFLGDGDVYTARVEGLGELTNTFVLGDA